MFLCSGLSLLCFRDAVRGQSPRVKMNLNAGWRTLAGNDDMPIAAAYQKNVDDRNWKKVNVPHNWDDYYGYRRLLHGNKHGDAWYRKEFTITQPQEGKRFFLYFEGVGSYATVYLNESKVGEHAGGRTTFTIDVTDHMKRDGSPNLLAVRAWHPPFIKDLPWVCGGCSEERGFSEGSQPMGIFRPVHLIVTNELRIEPFGVHAWAEIQGGNAVLNLNTTLKNYGEREKKFSVVHNVVDQQGKIIKTVSQLKTAKPKSEVKIAVKGISMDNIHLWSTEDPYLYRIQTIVKEKDKMVDEYDIDFGFRTVNWRTATNQFYLNGKPVFINGVAEYEHLIGQSHAFSPEQIASRVKWISAAGFNGFRDGHQPHNLLYGKLFNKEGILWWTQLSAHIWYDTPEFRRNFKEILKEWVVERRNDPSVVMWGLQNESKLPKDFAEECTELIRSLDPTASSQRLVTTCNGGEGTDWDVPQNWTGTYGGNPDTYGEDLKRQVLVGEYGAWRTMDLHTEGGFVQNGPVSVDRFTLLMEKKVRLAEAVKDSVAGHFFWLLTSHDNPGRVQAGEGFRELDRVGPVNYKGMLTPWEEPTDVFYMYRSNYVSADKEPMVYIASHTWPNRWIQPGIKDSIFVYSNCDEVELFNDIDDVSLGKKTRNGIGTHFLWDKVNIRYNILYAVGYVNGKAVARDTISLLHLPQSPNYSKLFKADENVTKAGSSLTYLYRINSGGGDYIDENDQMWMADRQYGAESEFELRGYGSKSWTDNFPGMSPYFASQRRTFAPIKGTRDWSLFQSFRYGRHELRYDFSVPDNKIYRIELYFIEPWLGIGNVDATGMRIFNVAINDSTVLKNFDIWQVAGQNQVVKRVFDVRAKNGRIKIDFPDTRAGQAIISAIAVAQKTSSDVAATASGKGSLNEADPKPAIIKEGVGQLLSPVAGTKTVVEKWLDIGDKQHRNKNILFSKLAPALFGADWLRGNGGIVDTVAYKANMDIDFYVGIDTTKHRVPMQMKSYERSGTEIVTDETGGINYQVFKTRFKKGDTFLFTQQDGDLSAFLFMIQPSDNMQPAFDLKPITSYKPDVAIFNREVAKQVISGNERTVIISNGAAEITWPIKTGVADVYSITIKYHSASEKEIDGIVQLFDAGNSKLTEEVVKFKLTRKGKWNFIVFDTGSMINAGYYKVKLFTKGAKGLIISNIDVQ